jgi:hypothetical protein
MSVGFETVSSVWVTILAKGEGAGPCERGFILDFNFI